MAERREEAYWLGRAARGHLVEPRSWATEATCEHLVRRGLLRKDGMGYRITEAGRAALSGPAPSPTQPSPEDTGSR